MKSQPRKRSPSVCNPLAGMMLATLPAQALGLARIPVAHAATAGQITHLSGTLSAKRADGNGGADGCKM